VHNVSDIIGGFLIAIIFTTPYVIKAIGMNNAFIAEIDGPPELDDEVVTSLDHQGYVLPVYSSTAGAATADAAAAQPQRPSVLSNGRPETDLISPTPAGPRAPVDTIGTATATRHQPNDAVVLEMGSSSSKQAL